MSARSLRSRTVDRLGWDRVEQLAPFLAVEHRRLAGLHHVLRAAHRGRGIGWHHLTGD
jgi:hypothetical protein